MNSILPVISYIVHQNLAVLMDFLWYESHYRFGEPSAPTPGSLLRRMLSLLLPAIAVQAP